MNRESKQGKPEKIIPIPKFNENFLRECENVKLLMEKYLKLVEKQDNKYFFNSKNLMKTKSEVFEKVRMFNKEKCNSILKQIHQRMRLTGAEEVKLKTASRLVIGLGSTSVLEVSIKLHHIYGVPYIPSTAIKGILRAYNILRAVGFNLEKYKQLEREIDNLNVEEIEKTEKLKKDIVKLFGNQKFKGKLIVLDAYPTTCPNFEEDIINVHFNNYYQNNKPPAENMNPNPIKFLTIAKGTEFIFYFLNKSSYKELTNHSIEEDLKQATYYLGLGAKSSLGYGVLV
mgnify:CR=1 FL=1